MIEPSVEFQYRELETTLAMAKEYGMQKIDVGREDLRLPLQLLERRRKDSTVENRIACNKIALLILEGKLDEARASLQ